MSSRRAPFSENTARSTEYSVRSRSAFTLFELILAIALSAALLALVGTAINLYLMRVDASRTSVEEAQLARSILAMIAADIRATTVYQTQDISTVAQLASASAEIDVDAIDDSAPFSGSAIGDSSGAGGGGGGAGGSSSAGSSDTGQSTTTMAPGLNGTLNELYLDVSRLPRLDELFTPVAAPAATAVATAKPSDAKTIRYFVRQGAAIDGSDVAATSLAPAEQLRAGGLVRQTLDQAVRTAAEQTGNTALLESGQVLLAPEVTAIEFRFFDGTTAVTEWNMRELETLPPAVEVRIWITAADDAGGSGTPTSNGTLMPGTRMYCQTVDLPLAGATSAAASASGEDESADSDAGGTGGTGGTGGLGDQQ